MSYEGNTNKQVGGPEPSSQVNGHSALYGTQRVMGPHTQPHKSSLSPQHSSLGSAIILTSQVKMFYGICVYKHCVEFLVCPTHSVCSVHLTVLVMFGK